ncbi:hypothetical protein NDU88_006990, partial [Pleurodeles waltl]
ALFQNIQKRFLQKLQMLQNAAACLLLGTHKHQSVSHGLTKLYWLLIDKIIQFKPSCIAFKALHNVGPYHLRHRFT